MVEWITMPLGMEVGLDPGHSVRLGLSSPPRKGAQQLPLSAHVYCGQTAGWTRIPLGRQVGLVPGDSVKWVPSSPHGKGHSSPHFSVHFALARSSILATAELVIIFSCQHPESRQSVLRYCKLQRRECHTSCLIVFYKWRYNSVCKWKLHKQFNKHFCKYNACNV